MHSLCIHRPDGSVCSATGTLTWRAALTTTAKDREMRSVQHEVVVLCEPALEIVHQIRRRLEHPAADVTHHVDVVILRRPVGRRPVPQMGVPNQSNRLEELERPVDGGEIDLGDGLPELLRGRMPELPHGSQDPIALRGHPQAPRVQLRGKVRSGANRRVGVVLVSGHRGPS
jgi:hypothetical protein